MSEPIDQTTQERRYRAQRLKIMHAIALVTDAPNFYKKAIEFGDRAALGQDDKLKRSQITGLETLANSTQKVTDIFDYLKIRTARLKEWQREGLGRELLAYLETGLQEQRSHVLARAGLTDPDKAQKQEIYMLLIRAFLAHLAAQYEYACLTQEVSSHDD